MTSVVSPCATYSQESASIATSPGSTNSTPAIEPADAAVEQPARVDGELLGLRTGQQHAVAQRVQEPALADPAPLVDELRCITAICPAGPPKVCSEIRNHAFVASRRGTRWRVLSSDTDGSMSIGSVDTACTRRKVSIR